MIDEPPPNQIITSLAGLLVGDCIVVLEDCVSYAGTLPKGLKGDITDRNHNGDYWARFNYKGEEVDRYISIDEIGVVFDKLGETVGKGRMSA